MAYPENVRTAQTIKATPSMCLKLLYMKSSTLFVAGSRTKLQCSLLENLGSTIHVDQALQLAAGDLFPALCLRSDFIFIKKLTLGLESVGVYFLTKEI